MTPVVKSEAGRREALISALGGGRGLYNHRAAPRHTHTSRAVTSTMRAHFSIEWLSQSSQSSPSSSSVPSSSSACGTHAESLPGFYCSSRAQSVQSTAETEAGFSSCTEEETSGYESEGGRSPSPAAPADGSSAPPPSPPSGRRPRTAFTAEQIGSLEKAFKRNAYLGTEDKAELCRKLNLADKQIRNWFQNRRMKLKRTVQDALAHACQASVASQFLHYPELQAFRPGPHSRYHQSAHEGPAAVYPLGLQFSSSLPAAPTLPLDSFYQYSSLPGVALPSAPSQVLGSYPTFPQYY
ncbi:ventrally expressed dharma/bozozok antagonist [Genypterus blacodes]|uniref:ventrally expressed dharma/bozozok antagonist n=1 Tax=Genypterus blacodes TaxID=154954 RepID=UPI003F75A382